MKTGEDNALGVDPAGVGAVGGATGLATGAAFGAVEIVQVDPVHPVAHLHVNTSHVPLF
jgi:hypothetical protein